MIEKKYGIIGKSLSHSLSPVLHNYWFRQNNIKASYSLIEIDNKQIKDVIDKIRAKDLCGVNVTIPYKLEVIPHLDLIINDANETSSVNTIYLNSENKIVGENTDVYGFEKSLIDKLDDKDLSDKFFFILGAGGVTSSLIYALKKKNIKNILISNRTLQKAKDIKKKFPFIEIIPWEAVDKKSEEADIIINATSLGMKNSPDFEKLIEKVKPSLVYYDVIYNPLETKMLKNFKEKKN
jgi:shikimate dehydrogenase